MRRISSAYICNVPVGGNLAATRYWRDNMAVPPFKEFFYPVLKEIESLGKARTKQVSSIMEMRFELSEEDRQDQIPSQKQTRVYSRTGWAIQRLKAAGLIDNTGWGQYRVTRLGEEALAKGSEHLNSGELRKYKQRSTTAGENNEQDDGNGTDSDDFESSETPDERIGSAYSEARSALERDLLASIKKCSPQFLERLSLSLLTSMGYGTAKMTGGPKDGGIDGVIWRDKFGLDKVYVQAKRHEGSISRQMVSQFHGDVQSKGGVLGVFVTTATFTSDAKKFVEENKSSCKVELVDGQRLTSLMVEHELGVNVVDVYKLMEVAYEYFMRDEEFLKNEEGAI